MIVVARTLGAIVALAVVVAGITVGINRLTPPPQFTAGALILLGADALLFTLGAYRLNIGRRS